MQFTTLLPAVGSFECALVRDNIAEVFGLDDYPSAKALVNTLTQYMHLYQFQIDVYMDHQMNVICKCDHGELLRFVPIN